MSSGQIRIDCGRAGPAATESSSGCACSGGGDRRCICRRRDRWDGGLELQVQWVQVQVRIRIRVQDFVWLAKLSRQRHRDEHRGLDEA